MTEPNVQANPAQPGPWETIKDSLRGSEQDFIKGPIGRAVILLATVFWAFEIPLAWFLARGLGMGPDGAFWAITVAFSVLAGVAAVIWSRGKWRLSQV